MKITAKFLSLIVLFSLITSASAERRYGGYYAQGVAHFYQKNYGEAIAAFQKAEVANPGNHAAYLWHGLALAGNDDLSAAHDVWTMKMPWDTKAKALAYYLRGLGHWRLGETQSAKYWFGQTLNYKETPGYALANKATLDLLNDKEVPKFDKWPTLAALPSAIPAAAAAKPQAKAPAQKAAPAKPAQKPAPAKAGAKPQGGLWKATITNGYKGQTLTFRVSADGKSISGITFKGYLICRGRRSESTQLAPLRNVPIKNGGFNDTQLNGSAKVRFDFTGTFNSATSATGTYRVISDVDCDSYKLIWKASRS